MLWVTEVRNTASLQPPFDQLSDEQKASIRAAATPERDR
jgi:hypothetical protein